MTKAQKAEWAYFIGPSGRITYDEKCAKCIHGCKQSFRTKVMECPNYRVTKDEDHPGVPALISKPKSN